VAASNALTAAIRLPVSPPILAAVNEDAGNLAALERCWRLRREGDDAGLEAALAAAPEIVRDSFLKGLCPPAGPDREKPMT
jgi:hypothetical protein